MNKKVEKTQKGVYITMKMKCAKLRVSAVIFGYNCVYPFKIYLISSCLCCVSNKKKYASKTKLACVTHIAKIAFSLNKL